MLGLFGCRALTQWWGTRWWVSGEQGCWQEPRLEKHCGTCHAGGREGDIVDGQRRERVQGSGGGRQARLGGPQGEGGLVLDGVGTVLPLSQEGKQMVWAKCGQGDDLRWESGARPVEASGSQ